MSRDFEMAMARNRARYEREERFKTFRQLPWFLKVIVYLTLAAGGAIAGFGFVLVFELVKTILV